MTLSIYDRSITWTTEYLAATIDREMNDYKRQVGQRLRALRKARHWNQEDAAHAVGVAVKTWRLWETGKSWPYDSNWEQIEKTFEVPSEEITGTPPDPLGLESQHALREQLDRVEQKLDQLLIRLGDPGETNLTDQLIDSTQRVTEALLASTGTEAPSTGPGKSDKDDATEEESQAPHVRKQQNG